MWVSRDQRQSAAGNGIRSTACRDVDLLTPFQCQDIDFACLLNRLSGDDVVLNTGNYIKLDICFKLGSRWRNQP
jgi:hypothetical protein